MSAGTIRGPRASPVAVVFLLAALLLGVAGALLSGPAPLPPVFPAPSGLFLSYPTLVGLSALLIALVVIWIGYRLVQRIRDPSGAQMMTRPMAVFAIMFLLFLGFIAASHFLAAPAPASGVAAGNGTTPPGNSTSPPHGGAAGNVTFGVWSVPWWSAYAGVIAVAVVVAVVAVPLALALRSRRTGEAMTVGTPTAADRARAEIVDTLARLEADPDADPRALIVALYGRLLAAVDPKIEDLESRTAREVEALAVARLALPRPAARELTALFEEARYSEHLLTREDTIRARAALRRVLEHLGAGSSP
ncbi:MAG TPA: DUF4129 domain-containing protein [Thermoplasmata archaeon]|nr:DUF4129 domain-containing protein [Thermoplasmata archaeon]